MLTLTGLVSTRIGTGEETDTARKESNETHSDNSKVVQSAIVQISDSKIEERMRF